MPQSPDDSTVSPPSLGLLALEARVVAELPLFLLRSRFLAGLPRGDGRPVLVVPGYGFDDRATIPLRSALGRLGYAAYGWELGANLGSRPGVRRAVERLLQVHQMHDAPVTLVGWSLGGVYSREMARLKPEHVRGVFSLGSPISRDPDANNIRVLGEWLRRTAQAPTDRAAFDARSVPPPVPCVAIYTKTDGIVAWPCCLEPPAANTKNVEVRGSHAGLVCNMEVLEVLARGLREAPVASEARPI